MVGFPSSQAARCGRPLEGIVYHGAAGMSKTFEKQVTRVSLSAIMAFHVHSHIFICFKVIAGCASAERRVVVERPSSRAGRSVI